MLTGPPRTGICELSSAHHKRKACQGALREPDSSYPQGSVRARAAFSWVVAGLAFRTADGACTYTIGTFHVMCQVNEWHDEHASRKPNGIHCIIKHEKLKIGSIAHVHSSHLHES
jgi:hypothetical protein